MHVVRCGQAKMEALGRAWQAAYRGLMPDDYLDGLRAEDRAAQWTRILTSELHPPRAIFSPRATTAGSSGSSLWAARWMSPTPRADRLCALTVAPERWRRGVGRTLLAAACTHVRGVGFATAVLLALPDTARACRFYRAAGWRVDGTVASTRSASRCPRFDTTHHLSGSRADGVHPHRVDR
jgi:GNAT superfamily N-acetyltransferase